MHMQIINLGQNNNIHKLTQTQRNNVQRSLMIHNITISPIFSTITIITIINANAQFSGPPKWRALERALASTPCLLVSLLLPLILKASRGRGVHLYQDPGLKTRMCLIIMMVMVMKTRMGIKMNIIKVLVGS